MQLIRGQHNLRPQHRHCVATIGNFDGVHLGHQAVLGQLAESADKLGLPTTIITFEPTPQEYFNRGEIPPRLTRLREKIQALRRFSVQRVLCLKFNRQLASLTANEFIQQILIDGLAIKHLVVGDDFHFGADRKGDFALLQQVGERVGFEVAHMHTFSLAGGRVSSTRIRKALQLSELPLAAQLLGRPYRMCGRVAHGNQLGRTIGFPTANIYLHRQVTPVQGVFAVRLFGIKGEPFNGVANVGTRPTLKNGSKQTLLEVHLLDFEGDIYGRYVQVEFLHPLREEQRFANFDALKAQIAIDAAAARSFFAHGG
ncbi:MAG: bifunctional riboflavin kinase/FAD synthetase [Gammaproteobacteria bacterium]|nr:bifunctional riboflavin kinase/FAD synthetase [Gammaproteobacteria bacterium]